MGTNSPALVATPSAVPSATTVPEAPCTPVTTGEGAIGFEPLALTFVSSLDGWVLGTSSSNPGSCVSLYRTTDGGASWSPTPAPPAFYPPLGCSIDPSTPCVDRVLFATTQRGFAFAADWGDAYETTDGGEVWNELSVTDVSAMALMGDVALRLQATPGGCTSGACQLERSTDGGMTWSSTGQPLLTPEGREGDVLLPGNAYAYAIGFGNPAGGGPETADFYRSSDLGATWVHAADPCSATSSPRGPLTISTAAASAEGGVLAVVCLPDRNAAEEFVMVSSDGGISFGPSYPAPTGDPDLAARSARVQTAAMVEGGEVQVPSDSLFAAGSASVLAIATSDGLSVSHNGGLTWSATYSCPLDGSGHGGISFVGFESASAAHLICGSAVARSSDGGLTWTTYTFPG